MPSQTFFNLPDDKRNRIIECAIEEFSTNTFEKCSIARIVEGSKIPRGSFYQYFTDLKDLYLYILKVSSEKKLHYFNQEFPELSGNRFDFFKTLREIYVAGINFAENHPELAAIGINFLKSTDEQLKKEVYAQQEPVAKTWFINLLDKGKQMGQIELNIEDITLYFLISSLNNTITDYYLAPHLTKENFAKQKDSLINLLDQMLYVLENGMRNKQV